eukprot:gene24545-biopygen8952
MGEPHSSGAPSTSYTPPANIPLGPRSSTTVMAGPPPRPLGVPGNLGDPQ